ncbi:MAG TPA: hypothetical protein VFP72_14680 [Kineosporiaceae bacterium]|nr:hypothetical protein [Kineosporiaceae bacterium]
MSATVSGPVRPAWSVVGRRVLPIRWWGLVALLAGLAVLLALFAGRPAAAPAPRAMSAECHQAYWGYLQSFDRAEADFWAESWVEFGCESGSSGLVA